MSRKPTPFEARIHAPYYSQAVRIGMRSIADRFRPETEDEMTAIRYIREREAWARLDARQIKQRAEDRARIMANSQGRGKAGACSPVSAPTVPVAPAKADAMDSGGVIQ